MKFLDEEVLQKAGFPSRKAMKEAMYTRAKVGLIPIQCPWNNLLNIEILK
jgi:hypothetical protein